jgi:hypothetical protein
MAGGFEKERPRETGPLFFCYQRPLVEPVASWAPIPLDREKEEEEKKR